MVSGGLDACQKKASISESMAIHGKGLIRVNEGKNLAVRVGLQVEGSFIPHPAQLLAPEKRSVFLVQFGEKQITLSSGNQTQGSFTDRRNICETGKENRKAKSIRFDPKGSH